MVEGVNNSFQWPLNNTGVYYPMPRTEIHGDSKPRKQTKLGQVPPVHST